jgi:vacuolar-type H+-ATPase subunit I/STV1
MIFKQELQERVSDTIRTAEILAQIRKVEETYGRRNLLNQWKANNEADKLWKIQVRLFPSSLFKNGGAI